MSCAGGKHSRTVQRSPQSVEAGLDLLLDDSRIAVAVHELTLDESGKAIDFTCLRINEPAARQFGRRPDELIGQPASAVLPGLRGLQLLAQFERAVVTDEAVHFCEHLPWSDRYLLLQAQKLGGLRFAVISYDVTAWKLSESALSHESAMLTSLLDSIPDMVFFKDCGGVYLGCNPAFEEFVGRPRDEIIGYRDIDLVPAELAALFRDNDERALTAQRPLRNDEWVTFPDGRRVLLETIKTPYRGPDGHTIGIVGISRDVTWQRQTEAELRQALAEADRLNAVLEEQRARASVVAAEAAEANAAKSRFLANMSHEIRTPMTAILGYAEQLLLEHGIERAPAARREAIEIIQRNGQSLLQLINEILDLSKIEAERMQLQVEPYDPVEVVTDVVRLLQIRALDKRITLHLETSGPLPAQLFGDSARLRQALTNLVGNGIKFTDRGGVAVVLALDCANEARPTLQFHVRDTGIGISQAALEGLFQPFSQADDSTTRRFGGTGLGLVISRHLARLMGGDITVTSTPSDGSTFTLTLPTPPLAELQLVQPQAPVAFETVGPPVTASPAAPSLHGRRILLAEDGPDNQRLLTLILRKAGATIALVGDGRAAVDQALSAEQTGQVFDVILMDMQMPVLDGYGAAAELRAAGYTRPIIALTANAMSGDREKCETAGCDDYVGKPIDRMTLLQTLARWATQGRGPTSPNLTQSADAPA